MKVRDLLDKMFDSYVEIAINEYKEGEYTGRRWIIPVHSKDYTDIPEDVLDSDVSGIVAYYDRISIEINVK